ncbi:MAG TPA: Rrf2 family transcriptional regulator [Candidatus Limnocylindria bacterium]|jgi:Rrf2 family protein|nr:Rrf2 family transcriptional regulator [Candidatus Limnocylindria bacterium]
MALNTQFSIAVHLLVGLGCVKGGTTTSGHLAQSVNTSASFVRRTLAKLSKAGLVETTTGKSGACGLAKPPEQISLLDVYRAVDAPKVFAIHSYTNQQTCPVSCNIKAALENALAKTQSGMESSLAQISLAEVITNVRK